jgi:hypothetical protein
MIQHSEVQLPHRGALSLSRKALVMGSARTGLDAYGRAREVVELGNRLPGSSTIEHVVKKTFAVD